MGTLDGIEGRYYTASTDCWVGDAEVAAAAADLVAAWKEFADSGSRHAWGMFAAPC